MVDGERPPIAAYRPVAKLIAAERIRTEILRDLAINCGVRLTETPQLKDRWLTIVARHLNAYDERG